MPFTFKALATLPGQSATTVLLYTVPTSATSAIVSNISFSSSAAGTLDLQFFKAAADPSGVLFARVPILASASAGFFNEITLTQGNTIKVTSSVAFDAVVFGAERT